MKKIFTLVLVLASFTLTATILGSGKSKSEAKSLAVFSEKQQQPVWLHRTAAQDAAFSRLEARNRFRIARVNHELRASLAVR
ncbi:MAG: hypothetical protein IPP73_15300 [Chitinophagaceae bacterium]|nr:hypothetical protein [Chitinophagaceae bacterium]